MYVHRFYCLIKFVVYVKHIKRETSVNNSRYWTIFLRKVLGDYKTKMRVISLTDQLSGQERISRFKHRYSTVKQSDVCGYMGLPYKTGRLVTQLVQQDQAKPLG